MLFEYTLKRAQLFMYEKIPISWVPAEMFVEGQGSQKMPPLPIKTKIKAPHMVKKALLKEKNSIKTPIII